MDDQQLAVANGALLVVDVQEGFVNDETCKIPGRISRFLDTWADRFELVAVSRFVNKQASLHSRLLNWRRLSGPPETDFCEGIERPGFQIVEKTGFSAITPELLAAFRLHDIKALFVCGLETDVCVLHNAATSFESGVLTFVLSDLCASTHGPVAHDAALQIIGRAIGRSQVLESTDLPQLSLPDY